MSNETQTTPTDIMPPAQVAGMTEYPVGDVALEPFAPGPVITAADADNLTIENVQAAVAALTANDGAPIRPPLTREEMAEPLPLNPAPQIIEGYLSGGGIVVTKDFTPQAGVDIVIDHQRRLDCEADYRASQASNVPAAEPESPAPEREKVWNINLQAWV